MFKSRGLPRNELVVIGGILAIVNLFYRRFHHGAHAMSKWRFHSKRLLIRQFWFYFRYSLRRNWNLNHILLFCEAHCTSQKLYVRTNTICENNIPDILFLRTFNLNSVCSARGIVSYLFFFYATNIPRSTVDYVYSMWAQSDNMLSGRWSSRRPS